MSALVGSYVADGPLGPLVRPGTTIVLALLLAMILGAAALQLFVLAR